MDLELLALESKKGNKNATEKILESLKPFILKQCKSIFISGYETEDLIQIGYISVLKAIKNYDTSKKGRFLSYVTSSIKNNYYYEIRQKHNYNSESSLNKEVDDGVQIIDLLVSNENIEDNIILKQEKRELIQAINKLSKEDIEFINSIYFLRTKIKNYSEFKKIKYSKCIKLKKKILKELLSSMINFY